MEENYTKIIIAILTIVSALIGGAIYSKKKSNKVNQKNIDIKGDNNKVVGGDDNSQN